MADALERYRAGVLGPTLGPRVEAAARALRHQAGLEIGAETLKWLPSGVPADHPRAEWLQQWLVDVLPE